MSSMWPSPEDYARIEAEETAERLRELKRWLALFDRAMGDEKIEPARRDRVINRVLHGQPTQPATRDWAEPLPRDLAVLDMLGEAAPACVRTRPTWDVPPVNG